MSSWKKREKVMDKLQASRCDIVPGKWLHHTGTVYVVKAVARFHLKTIVDSDGSYRLTEDPRQTIELFIGKHEYFHVKAGAGDLVFYEGSTGRWARSPGEFLGLTHDGRLRFEFMGEETNDESLQSNRQS